MLPGKSPFVEPPGRPRPGDLLWSSELWAEHVSASRSRNEIAAVTIARRESVTCVTTERSVRPQSEYDTISGSTDKTRRPF